MLKLLRYNLFNNNMKNKIAVLVCGQFREFNVAVKSWGLFFDLNCDFYFSTWNKSSQSKFKWPTYLNNVESEVTKEMITDKISNAIVSILNEDKYNHIHKITDKQILHWKNALKMCCDSVVEYDVIIVMRPDMFFDFFDLKRYVDNLKNQEIKTNNSPLNFFDDTFFMGKFDTIKTFIENVNELKLQSIHEDLFKHLIDLGINLDFLGEEVNLTEVRPSDGAYKDNVDFASILLSKNEFILKYDKKNYE